VGVEPRDRSSLGWLDMSGLLAFLIKRDYSGCWTAEWKQVGKWMDVRGEETPGGEIR